MKLFETCEIREAYQHAADGEQALHVWEPMGYEKRPGIPKAFKKNNKEWAHLFDQDKERLIATARKLGVRVIFVSQEGYREQHIDLCGKPLEKAIKLCKDNENSLFGDS